MYSHLLIIHSYFRWIVLIIMLLQAVYICKNHFQKRHYQIIDFRILFLSTIFLDIQLLLGWLLFVNSPLVHYFWQDMAKNMSNRQLRFLVMY